ncbi:hypothetical protein H8693_07275 [Christensenellaceae bacterium NSJ-63]|uniref:Sporulation protein YtaF n=1 Tax=Guopingia tenuis TaxID=2763656 RepID=A0A926DJ68_9FIRM|nr:hypothetical protein [Guopingia tenuis]MBC8538734.1 hypothetical protein [Guopingia tenuis]MBS5645582.1 hypothetical protein [Clostridiales bacterium]
MDILSVLLIGVATNLDNLLIGAALGLRRRHISWMNNLLIALCSGAAALVCCSLSSLLAGLGRLPAIFGGSLLILLGVLSLLPAKGAPAEEKIMQAGAPAKLSPGESLMLGVALALNCLAAAFGVGMSGLSPLLVGLFVGGFSFLSVGIGNVLGLTTGKKLNGRLLSLLSAIAMMGLGLLQIFT